MTSINNPTDEDEIDYGSDCEIHNGDGFLEETFNKIPFLPRLFRLEFFYQLNMMTNCFDSDLGMPLFKHILLSNGGFFSIATTLEIMEKENKLKARFYKGCFREEFVFSAHDTSVAITLRTLLILKYQLNQGNDPDGLIEDMIKEKLDLLLPYARDLKSFKQIIYLALSYFEYESNFCMEKLINNEKLSADNDFNGFW